MVPTTHRLPFTVYDFYDFYDFYGFYDLNDMNDLNDLNGLPLTACPLQFDLLPAAICLLLAGL